MQAAPLPFGLFCHPDRSGPIFSSAPFCGVSGRAVEGPWQPTIALRLFSATSALSAISALPSSVLRLPLLPLILPPKKQMRHRHQQHRPNRSRRQRIQKRIRMHNPQLRKNPSPNHRPNQPNQNIANTPKPAPSCHLSRQPTRQQPNQQPPNQSPLPLHNHHPLRQSNHPQHSNHRHPSSTSSLFSAHSALAFFLFSFHRPALSLPNG